MSRLACCLALGVLATACADPRSDGDDDCPLGGMGCACTQGGGCDAGLACLGGVCLATPDTDSDPTQTSMTNATTQTSQTTPTTEADTSTSADTDDLKLDVGEGTTGGMCSQTGCKQIDLLFALDSSLSMSEEIGALAAGAAFADIVFALENLNCGDIEYRIGLTNDNDGGFLGTGANGHPWFDSGEMTAAEITGAFSQAAAGVLGTGGTALGCEHVLSSATDLLVGDTTGFVREDALLVVVLVTDVDDYGEYDQLGWPQCTCPLGICDQLCTTAGRPVDDIYADLLALKGGDPAALGGIVLAGDPAVTEGMNMCSQPASCCGGGLECGQAHHAPRLWDFAMTVGAGGVTADFCDGAEMVPVAIESALGGPIDLACQTFRPAG
jgi:hypothetical protein